MAPEALNDLLNAVAPGRRQFLKTILTGTAFAAPLMASFSMDGLSVDAAAAQFSSNMTFCSNMSISDFVMEPLTCSNMTTRHRETFRAMLRDGRGKHRGKAAFVLKPNECVLQYDLSLDDDGVLETVNYGAVGVPAAVLVIQSPRAEYGLSRGRGEIGIALPSLGSMEDLLNALRFGQADVVVLTNRYEASGDVVPT